MKKLIYKGVEFDDFQLYNGEPERYGDCQSESLDGFEGVDVYVCPHCVKKYGLYSECGTTEEKAQDKALQEICEKLYKALPELGIEVSVELYED